jgi:hypothetical protein
MTGDFNNKYRSLRTPGLSVSSLFLLSCPSMNGSPRFAAAPRSSFSINIQSLIPSRFSRRGRDTRMTLNFIPSSARDESTIKRCEPNTAANESRLLDLPAEIRQHILLRMVSDGELLASIPIMIKLQKLHHKVEGGYVKDNVLEFSTSLQGSKRLALPDMAKVHSILAEDMEWVKKKSIKKAKELESLKPKSLGLKPNVPFACSMANAEKGTANRL